MSIFPTSEIYEELDDNSLLSSEMLSGISSPDISNLKCKKCCSHQCTLLFVKDMYCVCSTKKLYLVAPVTSYFS